MHTVSNFLHAQDFCARNIFYDTTLYETKVVQRIVEKKFWERKKASYGSSREQTINSSLAFLQFFSL